MAESRNYQITVQPIACFVPEQSDTAGNRYVFAYTIHIKNIGTETAQLISRQWWITDAHGATQEVRGLGVVGEQPVLQPGESFEYTSGTAIATPTGRMYGRYQMVADDGVAFEAEVPEFELIMPRTLH